MELDWDGAEALSDAFSEYMRRPRGGSDPVIYDPYADEELDNSVLGLKSNTFGRRKASSAPRMPAPSPHPTPTDPTAGTPHGNPANTLNPTARTLRGGLQHAFVHT